MTDLFKKVIEDKLHQLDRFVILNNRASHSACVEEARKVFEGFDGFDESELYEISRTCSNVILANEYAFYHGHEIYGYVWEVIAEKLQFTKREVYECGYNRVN